MIAIERCIDLCMGRSAGERKPTPGMGQLLQLHHRVALDGEQTDLILVMKAALDDAQDLVLVNSGHRLIEKRICLASH